MPDNIPSSCDPLWKPSRTIWIRRTRREMKLNKGDRVKVPKIIEPSVCHAHGNASRFRRRLHVMEIGVRKSGTRKDSTTFLASTGTKVGMPLNPTGILVCGLQGGEHVPGEFDTLLRNGEWCETCKRALETYQSRSELSGSKQ